MVQPRLFPVPVDIALATLSREPSGWRLAIRACPTGGRLLEDEPDLYESLTLPELLDVLCAIVEGFEP